MRRLREYAASASAKGRRRQASGARTERSIEALVASYRQLTRGGDGLYRRRQGDEPPAAVLSRVHPKVVGAPGRMRVAEKATVDFVGACWLRERGWPLAFDCKSVLGKTSFQVPPDDWHQLTYLADHRAAGGLAGYVLEDRREQMVWLLTDLDTLLTGQGVRFRRLTTPPREAGARSAPWSRTAASFRPSMAWGLLPGTAIASYDLLRLFEDLLP